MSEKFHDKLVVDALYDQCAHLHTYSRVLLPLKHVSLYQFLNTGRFHCRQDNCISWLHGKTSVAVLSQFEFQMKFIEWLVTQRCNSTSCTIHCFSYNCNSMNTPLPRTANRVMFFVNMVSSEMDKNKMSAAPWKFDGTYSIASFWSYHLTCSDYQKSVPCGFCV